MATALMISKRDAIENPAVSLFSHINGYIICIVRINNITRFSGGSLLSPPPKNLFGGKINVFTQSH